MQSNPQFTGLRTEQSSIHRKRWQLVMSCWRQASSIFNSSSHSNHKSTTDLNHVIPFPGLLYLDWNPTCLVASPKFHTNVFTIWFYTDLELPYDNWGNGLPHFSYYRILCKQQKHNLLYCQIKLRMFYALLQWKINIKIGLQDHPRELLLTTEKIAPAISSRSS